MVDMPPKISNIAANPNPNLILYLSIVHVPPPPSSHFPSEQHYTLMFDNNVVISSFLPLQTNTISSRSANDN